MENILKKVNRWLLPVVLILFLLQTVTLPLAAGFTYADRAAGPDHVLHYSVYELSWDKNTTVNGHGVAQLDVFDADYSNVQSADGKNVVAPGTRGHNTVRLLNHIPEAVEYVAVLYRIRTDDRLPVEVDMTMPGSKPCGEYPLPAGVRPDQVITAVEGSIGGLQTRDIDISWNWDYYDSDTQDTIDTMLGSKAADTVTVGLYVIVEDNNIYHIPKTGDDSGIGMYFAIMLLSAGLLVLLLWERRREQECEELEDF